MGPRHDGRGKHLPVFLVEKSEKQQQNGVGRVVVF
jgi:hypothetical protein